MTPDQMKKLTRLAMAFAGLIGLAVTGQMCALYKLSQGVPAVLQ